MTEHKRLTTKEKYPHGAEGVSKDKLTGKYCRGVFEATACVEKLAEYETAEEEGRLKVFPCKVGDILFVITPDSPIGIETTKCIRLSIDKRGIKIQAPAVHDDWGNAKWNFKPIDFGKKVFLDFEEAKKALREMEEDQ